MVFFFFSVTQIPLEDKVLGHPGKQAQVQYCSIKLVRYILWGIQCSIKINVVPGRNSV